MKYTWQERLADDLKLGELTKRPGSDAYHAPLPISSAQMIVARPFPINSKNNAYVRNIRFWQGLQWLRRRLGFGPWEISHLIYIASLEQVKRERLGDTDINVVVTSMPGESLQELLLKERLLPQHMHLLGHYVYHVERLPFTFTLVTLKSLWNSLLFNHGWKKKFFDNLGAFASNVLGQATGTTEEAELRELVHSLYVLAEKYDAGKVGFCGFHGRPRFGYFSIYARHEDYELYVDAWETSSSRYIRYYELASMVCHCLAWLGSKNGYQIALEITKTYFKRLNAKEVDHFKEWYLPVFGQRMLGDLSDITGRNKTSDGIDVDMRATIDGIRRYIEFVSKL